MSTKRRPDGPALVVHHLGAMLGHGPNRVEVRVVERVDRGDFQRASRDVEFWEPFAQRVKGAVALGARVWGLGFGVGRS